MKAEIIRDWSSLDDLSGCWNSLLQQSDADSLFLTWEWVQAWGSSIGRRHALLVVVARDSTGRVCGIAPFYVKRYRLLGAIPYRMLHVVADTGADYQDVIVRRDQAEDALACIFEALSAHRRLWDGMWLPNVSKWNGAFSRLDSGREHLYSAVRPVEFSAIDLPATMDEYDRMLSAKRRNRLHSLRKKLFGASKIEITRCTTIFDVPAYLEALFELHLAHWRRKGQPGSFGPEKVAMYHSFARRAVQLDWLRLYGLKSDGQFKAVQIGYVYDRTFYALQEGFDPDFTQGVGNVLRYEIIQACIEEGIRSYDFLRGFSEHKRMWLAKAREGCDVFIGRRSALNYFLFKGGVSPSGRYLKSVPVCSGSRPLVGELIHKWIHFLFLIGGWRIFEDHASAVSQMICLSFLTSA